MSMAILGTAISAASSVMSGMAQQQAAQAQADYQQKLAIQQRDKNYEEQVALQKENAQKQEQVQREKITEQRAARKDLGAARVAAGSSGVSGTSIDALLADYATQHSMNLAALNRQGQLYGESNKVNVHNVATDTYTPAPVEKPSTGSILFGGLTSGLSNWMSH